MPAIPRWIQKQILPMVLIFTPVLLLISQQLTGFIPLRENTWDASIFSFFMVLLIAFGFTLQAKTPRRQLQVFVLSIVGLFAIPFIISGILSSNDALQGTNITQGRGFWFALDALSSQVLEWTTIIQLVVGLVPVVVVIIGVVMIFVADSVDEYAVALAEIGISIAIMVIAHLAFKWLGVSIF